MAAKSKTFAPILFGCLALACVVCMIPRCGSDIPTLKANPNRTDGTAVFILLDVSGSMDNNVKNAQGRDEPKLAIAKRAAIDACNAVAKYAAEDARRNIQIGIASFSDDYRVDCPMGKPDAAALARAINGLSSRGKTGIGDAVKKAQEALDKTALKGQHILVVTDGENTSGMTPEEIAAGIVQLPENLRPSVYLIAFDVQDSTFDRVKKMGWQIFSASNGAQLQQQLDEVVGGHILLEK